MKLHLPVILRSVLLASFTAACGVLSAPAVAATPSDWGNTVYIGDSISHGFKAQPYRWFLFKNLVDIGVLQTEVGVHTGYWGDASPVPTDEGSYRGVSFDNLHAARASITANQVSGSGYSDSSLLGGTGIATWLTEGGSYTMHTAKSPDTLAIPDTAFIMLGTNDIFNAAGNKGAGLLTSATLAQHTANMKQYLGTIVDELQKANPDVNIVINSIPTWSENRTDNSNGTAESYAALASLNASLQAWAEEQDGVTFLNINTGMIDVANTTKPGSADSRLCAANNDTQHPNAQGNLIIAGNMAQQLGYAGRTVGLDRRAAADFSLQAANIVESATLNGATAGIGGSLTLNDTDETNVTYVWGDADTSQGFTVDFNLANGLGNGETNGWDTTNNFSLSLGNGTYSGTLNINEAYILWGDTLLYSTDTSLLTEDLRVSYVVGDENQNISSGFYVWKGDMLIGEALGATSGTNGLTLTNNTGSTLTLGHLSLTAGSYAPTTTGLEYTTVSLTNITSTSNTNALVTQAKSSANITSGNLAIRVSGDSSINGDYLVASWHVYNGDIDVILGGTMTKNQAGKYNVVQYEGTLDGNISFTVAEDFITDGSQQIWTSFIGVEGASVKGNVSMTFSASDLEVGTGYNGRNFSLAGADQSSNIKGHSRITVNAGTFNSDIYGGNYGGSGTIGKGTEVILNGGIVKGNIYGGGTAGTIESGSAVTVSGGATVDGTLISAGGTAGTIKGGTTLTVKDVTSDSAFYTSFLKDSANTLSGNNGATLEEGSTRELRFDGVTLDAIAATVENFDAVTVTGGSQLTLTPANLGGAKALTVNEGSTLTMSGSTTLDSVTLELGHANLQQAGANLVLTNGALTTGTLTLNLDNMPTAADPVTLWMYQGTLNATNVEVNANLGEKQTMSYKVLAGEDGYSCLEYKISAYSTLTSVSLGNNDNALVAQGKNDAGVTSGELVISVSGTSTSLINDYLVASQGDYTGNVDIILDGTLTNDRSSAAYNVVQFTGTLDGDISFTVAEHFTTIGSNRTWKPFLGAQDATVTGDVSMTFSADDMTVGAQGTTRPFSLAGADGDSNINGRSSITVNAGTFKSDIYGGFYKANADSNTITGGTEVVLNGGTVEGNVYGGSAKGSKSGGTIKGGSAVTVSGGATVNGSLISAGGTHGTIKGGTTLTVKDVTGESAFYTSFLNDSANTLSGNNGATLEEGSTRELRFDGVTLGSIAATVENFDAVTITGGSQLTLTQANLGGATALTVDAGSKLTMNESLSMTTTSLGLSAANTGSTDVNLIFTNGGLTTNTLTLNLDSTLSSNTAATGSLLVNQGSLNAGWVNIKLAEGSNAGYLLFSGISHENGSSYVNYKKFDTAVEFDGSTSFDNEDGSAIADLAISQKSITSGNIAVSTNGGTLSSAHIVANCDNWTGDIVVELGGDLKRTENVGYNVAQYQGKLEGSMTQIITEGFQVVDANGNRVANAGTFVGANSTEITGDLTMVFSSEGLVAVKSYGTANDCVIAGTSSGDVAGAVNIIVNAGNFTGNVYGGSVSGENNEVGNGTHVTLNGGTVTGNVYGAGKFNTITKGGSAVTVTGDANVQSATAGSNAIISAGGTGGSIKGGTLLTVKDVTGTDSFASFSGILSGNEGATLAGENTTRTLCFDNAKLSGFEAKFRNFDVVNIIGQSDVLLNGLGNESPLQALNIEAGSRLSLKEAGSFSIEEATLVLGSDSQSESASTLNIVGDNSLTIQTLTLDLTAEFCEYVVSSPATMAFTDPATAPVAHNSLEGQLLLGAGTIEASTININLAAGYGDYSIASAGIEVRDGYSYVNYSLSASHAIPEPATATLSLLALAGLAARRRRKD